MIEKWHEVVNSRDSDLLDNLLDEDVIFFSPVIFSPQEGKTLTKLYLTGAMHVLANDNFKYINEVTGEKMAVLEFETQIDDIYVNGVDIIHWNEEEKITAFKVMIRPQKALVKVQEEMWKLLQSMSQ